MQKRPKRCWITSPRPKRQRSIRQPACSRLTDPFGPVSSRLGKIHAVNLQPCSNLDSIEAEEITSIDIRADKNHYDRTANLERERQHRITFRNAKMANFQSRGFNHLRSCARRGFRNQAGLTM